MIKAISLSLLLFTLAVQKSYSQAEVAPATATETETVVKGKEAEKSEITVSVAEQADRDLLIPRDVQEKLAAENANKTITYGKGTTPYRKPVRKYSSRKKTYSRSSSRRR